jgi:hypothetical protein
VIKAVTTPPHLPVFTGNAMWLSVELSGCRSRTLTSCGHCSVMNVASGGDPSSTVRLGQQESELPSTRIGVQHVTLVQSPV